MRARAVAAAWRPQRRVGEGMGNEWEQGEEGHGRGKLLVRGICAARKAQRAQVCEMATARRAQCRQPGRGACRWPFLTCLMLRVRVPPRWHADARRWQYLWAVSPACEKRARVLGYPAERRRAARAGAGGANRYPMSNCVSALGGPKDHVIQPFASSSHDAGAAAATLVAVDAVPLVA
eukprot:4908008-Prymnesium_polylepis.1